MLSIIDTPTCKDVLFGRDADSWNHEGNRNFRFVVAKYQEQYHSTKLRVDKVAIVAKIVKEMKETGARFLRRDCRTNKWFEVDRKAYIEKVGHAIRDRQVIRQRRLRKKNESTAKKLLAQSMTEHGKDERFMPRMMDHNAIAALQQQLASQNEEKYPILPPTKENIPKIVLSQDASFKNRSMVDSIIAAEASSLHQGREASVTIRDILKEELLLKSIKKKQAVTRELITLHRQTALLAALRTNGQMGMFDKHPLLSSRINIQPSLVDQYLAQFQGMNHRLSYWPVQPF